MGTGLFALVFLNASGTEVARNALDFAPPTLILGTGQTSSDGTYSISFTPLNSEGFQAQAGYTGTSALWPAFASNPLSTTPSIWLNRIVNAADLKVEPLPPDTWFTIFGQNLGAAAQWTTPNTLTLGGASVTVCGTPAAISYNSGPVITNGVAGSQLNALMPDAVAAQASCAVVVTVDGERYQQPLEIERDPRLNDVTDRDLQEQFALASQIRDKLSQANEAVIRIRALKASPSVAAIRAQLEAVEEELYQVRNRSPRDTLNYPIKLNNQLAVLQSYVDTGSSRPTDQQYAVFKELSRNLDAILARLGK